jgi:hypothetical protein
MYIVPAAFMAGILLAFFLSLVSTNLILPPIAQAAAMDQTSPLEQNEPPEVPANLEESLSHPNQSGCPVSLSFPDQILQWCDLITQAADTYNLEPDLLAALIWQESNGNPLAYSHSGAVGLMQVMPRDGLAVSFICQNGPCFKNRPTIEELQNPEFNVNYGSKMLAKLLEEHGNIREALKYYGPADVGYYYSDIVLSLYEQYRN